MDSLQSKSEHVFGIVCNILDGTRCKSHDYDYI